VRDVDSWLKNNLPKNFCSTPSLRKIFTDLASGLSLSATEIDMVVCCVDAYFITWFILLNFYLA